MQFEKIEFWKPWTTPTFLPSVLGEYLLLALYGVVAVVLLVYHRRDFRWRRLPLLLVFSIAPLFANHLLVVTFSHPNLLPPPNLPMPSAQSFAPLFGTLLIFVVGVWLGAGPALLVGLISGFLRVGMASGGIADLFHFAFFAFLIGYFLRQDYRGLLPRIVRQPIVAGPLAVLFASPVLLLSVLARTASSGLAGLDYALPLTATTLLALLLETAVAAIVMQMLYLVSRAVRPVRTAYRPAPYARSLNLRLLFLFVPLILIVTCLLLYAVTVTTLGEATAQVVGEMERNGNTTAEYVTYLIAVGEGQLDTFADDDALWLSGPAELESRLQGDVQSSVFFNQLLFFDVGGELVASSGGNAELTTQEERLLQNALAQWARPRPTLTALSDDRLVLSFMSPVEDLETGERFGMLLGRTDLSVNPMMRQVLQTLRWSGERGDGFVVERVEEGTWRIVAHPDPDMLLNEWLKRDEPPRTYEAAEPGEAYESRASDNTRLLVYFLPVAGYSEWAVVIQLPYEVVLEQAAQIAIPLLLLQLLMGGVLIVVIPFFTGLLTRPLQQLAAAARRIADGDLAKPVQMPGADEVAQLGDAFEGMRVRLKDRMEDLSLLLQISQAVSATLELPQGMPLILEGVLKATGAEVARVVLFSANGVPQLVMSRGAQRQGLGSLDRALAETAKDAETPLIVENLARAKSLADDTLTSVVRAVIALPVRIKDQVAAVMWVGYAEPRKFEDSEIDLLSTLAGQTAVLVENTRLFQAAEGGRRRLEAILTSTSDAVLVTDRDDRILLVNPAAEHAFGVRADEVVGQKVGGTALADNLARAFGEPLPSSEPLTEEVPLPDGRTLYASVSTIVSPDGEPIGRVVVMRDITHFKELDNLKSDFVATVSHDLRAPLTFMRGYASMLPMVGELTDKQSEYIDKILQGVGQMGELIDDLLDLGRVEAGVGLELGPCHLGAVLVEAVEGMRPRAVAKGLTLRLEPPDRAAVVAGDAALLRQMVANLVDNAIKYTPSGGSVTVGLSVEDAQALIRVTDTGIGIAAEDQVRLFEKFYRIKRRDTADIQGTGLGLAIVRSVVERHGGRVWVESELNKGSTFHLLLPLAESEQSGSAGRLQ
jgi:PAS domain S-box-containing protein